MIFMHLHGELSALLNTISHSQRIRLRPRCNEVSLRLEAAAVQNKSAYDVDFFRPRVR